MLLLILLLRILATLTVPTVSQMQEIDYNDTNVHINQTNTNTTDISNLKGGTGFTGAINVSKVNYSSGSLSRISIFSGSANNTGVNQAHGLGATPDAVMFIEVQSAADSCPFVWDQASSNSTNVKVWTNFATSRNYVAIALKQ